MVFEAVEVEMRIGRALIATETEKVQENLKYALVLLEEDFLRFD